MGLIHAGSAVDARISSSFATKLRWSVVAPASRNNTSWRFDYTRGVASLQDRSYNWYATATAFTQRLPSHEVR